MATFDSKQIVDDIIASNGYYETDPRVSQIVEYENYEGRTAWGVTWSTEAPAMQRRYEVATEYVNNPRVIWKADGPRSKDQPHG